MKNILAIAIITIVTLTSCNKKTNDETQNVTTTEQQVTSIDTINKTDQVKADSINQIQSEEDQIKAHGHAH